MTILWNSKGEFESPPPSLNPDQINLLHQAIGLHKRHDDLLIVQDVLVAELAVFAVFEPFLAGLVAADVKFPGDFGDVAEVLRVVDIDIAV